jgi:hypothetical protein
MTLPLKISFFSRGHEAHIDFVKSAGSEMMDQKREEDQGTTSHLLFSSSESPTKTILGHRDKAMLFSVMFS